MKSDKDLKKDGRGSYDVSTETTKGLSSLSGTTTKRSCWHQHLPILLTNVLGGPKRRRSTLKLTDLQW